MELLTIPEAAHIMKVSSITVRRHIAQGEIEAVRVGRQVRVPREALDQFIKPVATRKARGGPSAPQCRRMSFAAPLWKLVGTATDAAPIEAAAQSRIRQRVDVPESQLAAFCQRHHIRSLALFGSVLREDFRPDSDIDVLVEFQPGRTPGLLKLASIESELSLLFANRKVDLRTLQDLSPHFRDRVVREAVALCR